ncbi:unnamed protein product [Cercospora beticola]|nr:unnamed protein product [Cercospora beticola]
MAPPATRTSFKRSASEDADDTSVTSSKRAKASSRSSKAQTQSQESQDKSSTGERPKRFTPDGREIPYMKPRPNGSWRMITGEDIAYTPEERPTRAPASAYRQTSITQSFGQSTYSGKERKSKPQVKNTTSSSTKPKATTKPTMATASSSKQPNNEAISTTPTTGAGPSKSSTPNHLTLNHSISNIFSAPPNTLLLHACNTEGSWGAGIALAFKKSYPSAFETYRDHCRLTPSDELIGTALLIPPSEEDDSDSSKHFIGCLFTSVSKGQRKDSPDKILRATGTAVKDLVKKVGEWNDEQKEKKVGEVRMCKINSGLFGVKWERTQAVLEAIEVDGENSIRQIEVISRSEDD